MRLSVRLSMRRSGGGRRRDHWHPTLGLPNLHGRHALVAAIVLDSLGTGLFLPFAVLYPTLVAGIPLGVTGGILSLATLLALPMPLLAGLLVDRLGPRSPLVAASLLQGMGFAGYLVVTRPWQFFLCAACVAIGNQGYWAANGTFLSALSGRREDRPRWFALQGACRSAGLGAGAAAAGVIATVAATTECYRLLAALNAASFLLAAWLSAHVPLMEPAQVPSAAPAEDAVPSARARRGVTSRGSYRMVLRDGPFLGFTATNVAFSLCVLSFSLVLPVFVLDTLKQPSWLAGAIFALNTILVATTQTIVAGRIAVFRRTRALAFAACLFALAFALLALLVLLPDSPGPMGAAGEWVTLGLFAATGMYTLAEVVMAPLKNALVADAAPIAVRGRYLVFYHLSWSVASTLAPGLLTGLLAYSPLVLWLTLTGIGVVVAGALVRLDTLLPAHAVSGMRRPERV